MALDHKLLASYNTGVLRARAAYRRHCAALERGLPDDDDPDMGGGVDDVHDTPRETPGVTPFFWWS